MKFSVIHPTARVTPDFASPWWAAFISAYEGCRCPAEVEYVIVVHISRVREFRQHVFTGWWGITAFGRFVIVTNYGRDCLVDQCNAGVQAASGEILVWNQDDMRYPEGWDTEVSRLIPDSSQLVCVQARTDGSRRDLLTIPTICTRALARHIGLLPPEYEHGRFSDDEWSAKAFRMGSVVQSSLYFEHQHYTVGKSARDSVYDQANSEAAYQSGYEVYQKRLALGFPRVPWDDEKDVPCSAAVPASAPILAICIPGKTFSGEWFDSFMALGAMLRDEGYLVKRFRGYYSNAYQTRIDLASRVIEDARISGDVPKYVLWLDDDNCALPQQLQGLIRFLGAYSKVDAVSGWCWIRKPHGWTTSAGVFSEDTGVHLSNFNLDALFAGETTADKFAPKGVEQTGFPFLLMRYEALEHLGPHAFRPMTKADLSAYFDGNMPPVPVADHWFCGEDTAWCLRAKKAGLTLVVDPGCKVAHLKLQAQEPDFGRVVAAEPSAVSDRTVRDFREAVNGPAVTGPVEYERVIL